MNLRIVKLTLISLSGSLLVLGHLANRVLQIISDTLFTNLPQLGSGEKELWIPPKSTNSNLIRPLFYLLTRSDISDKM